MAEIVSRQAAKVAANQKMQPHEAGGRCRVAVITSPATVTWANGDTLASPHIIPAGSRFIVGSYISCAAMGASVVAAIGIRDLSGNVINASGIATAINVAAATQALASNGALVAAGVEYITTVPCQVYLTLSGATPTANAQIRAEVAYLTA